MLECCGKEKQQWFRRRIKSWAQKHLRDFPWRRTHEPYKILIAEFLLQQTDAPRVVPVYRQFLKKYPTLKSLAEASVSEIADLVKPLGFHYRASRMYESACLMVKDYKGRVPNDERQLLKLPGVGKYMARSICTNAFGQQLAVLDVNVARILQRFFGLENRRARARDDPGFWEFAQQVAPRTQVSTWNMSLLDFGALVCTSKKPQCSECPLSRHCAYFKMEP